MSEQIEPGEGWRLLGPDEVINDGDEVYIRGDWFGTEDAGLVVAEYIYRRRIPAKPEAMEIDHQTIKCNSFNDVMVIDEDEVWQLVSNTKQARQLADWLRRFADWREAQNE